MKVLRGNKFITTFFLWEGKKHERVSAQPERQKWIEG